MGNPIYTFVWIFYRVDMISGFYGILVVNAGGDVRGNVPCTVLWRGWGYKELAALTRNVGLVRSGCQRGKGARGVVLYAGNVYICKI